MAEERYEHVQYGASGSGRRIGAIAGLQAEQAAADPIGPDCDTCQGAIYKLESFLLDDNATEDLYVIRLTMNTAGLTTSPDPAFAIDSVAVKTTAQSDAWIDGLTCLQRPGGLPAGNQMPGGIKRRRLQRQRATDSSAKTGSAPASEPPWAELSCFSGLVW